MVGGCVANRNYSLYNEQLYQTVELQILWEKPPAVSGCWVRIAPCDYLPRASGLGMKQVSAPWTGWLMFAGAARKIAGNVF